MGFMSSVWAAPAVSKPFVVVIDAGHGGTDPGAIGRQTQEKDLNLAVALMTGNLITNQYPDVDVRYTRQADFFIPLQKRADIVNENNANLFICIHTNSAQASSANGMETFVLGTDKLDRNLDVAMRENAVIKLEKDYQTTYQGFDPNSVDSYIMFDLMQNQYLDQSLSFASLLQQQFAYSLKRGDRGVRQAAFWVLLKSACPSVLIEMGFISNPDDERYLASANGKKEISEAICSAFGTFYKETLKNKIDTNPIDNKEIVSAPKNESISTPTSENEPVHTPSIVYGVQLFASHDQLLADDPRFRGLKDVQFMQKGEWYKYYYGKVSSMEEAIELKKQIIDKFPDCFIIKIK